MGFCKALIYGVNCYVFVQILFVFPKSVIDDGEGKWNGFCHNFVSFVKTDKLQVLFEFIIMRKKEGHNTDNM